MVSRFQTLLSISHLAPLLHDRARGVGHAGRVRAGRRGAVGRGQHLHVVIRLAAVWRQRLRAGRRAGRENTHKHLTDLESMNRVRASA